MRTTLPSMSSGTASSSRSLARATSVGFSPRYAGQQLGHPALRGVGLAGGGDHLVPGRAQRSTEHGADAACADDADLGEVRQSEVRR